MPRFCPVCESYRPKSVLEPGQKLVPLELGDRVVPLCTGHARIARHSNVTSFDQLRALYGAGRRSYVPRRGWGGAPLTNEQRRNPGRRATDVAG